ncbi:MAG: type I-E CRISPR-associated protein Cse1/CasA [Syntrophobacterales bacterium]|jgi:CRISPR system Cascade subunit CasA|nr:type I-E CRISPR-associated protein Cse1/CasA [Syntrophobacterales bacterium]
MNVAFDPWIPVVTASGHPTLASLYTVLAGGEQFADLAVRPHERVSLMRLLLCVAHAALNGPRDYDDWCDVPKNLPGAVQKYLTDWKDSFELFHPEKPWLQVAELKGVEKGAEDLGKTSPVTLLDFELATGNNSTLFDHGGQMNSRQIEPERIALNLLTFQNFSSGGGSPVAQWKTTRTSQVGNPDAPCLSQSMAHCLLRGRSLAETTHFNLPTFENIKRHYRTFSTDLKKGGSYSDIALGRPVWEFFPESPEKESDRVINATKTYLGRLVPISRWIRLIQGSGQMYCCNGFRYDTYKDGFASEPTAAVRLVTKKDKKGAETTERRVVKVEPKKALWRELSSLLVKRSAEGLGGPLAMGNAPYDTEFDFHVCAITRDQASMDIALESVFHIFPAFLTHLSAYQAEVTGADKVLGAEGYSRKLRWAIEDYRQTIDNDWKPRVKRTQAKEQNVLRERLAQTAFLSYWTTVEKNLPLLMNHLKAFGTDAALLTREAWRKMLFSAACEAYRIACGQETPRQLRAFVKGWRKLTSAGIETDANTHETKEEEV